MSNYKCPTFSWCPICMGYNVIMKVIAKVKTIYGRICKTDI